MLLSTHGVLALERTVPFSVFEDNSSHMLIGFIALGGDAIFSRKSVYASKHMQNSESRRHV